MVQRSIDSARRCGNPIEAGTQQWMVDAVTAVNEASALGRPATNTCFCGCVSDPRKHWLFGRKAEAIIKEIQSLIRGCPQFESEYHENDPPGIVRGATDLNSLPGHGGDTIPDSFGSQAPGDCENRGTDNDARGGIVESDDKYEEGSTLSANISEPVHHVSATGSSRRRITSWKKGKRLGSGSFGTVYEASTDDGFFFAVKEVSLSDQGNRGEQGLLQLRREISLLSQLEHENIVRYFGTDKDHENLYIFLELMTGGSLATLYKKNNWRDSKVPAYTRGILNGLKYLHDRTVVHRDIKCANILVDASGSVKLSDFGLSKLTEISHAKTSVGIFRWMAPEVVNTQKRSYGPAADIWSLGATVLEMLTRKHPYPLIEEAAAAAYQTGQGIPPPVPDHISGDARDFILKCLQVDQDRRPSAAELLDHAFVRNPPT